MAINLLETSIIALPKKMTSMATMDHVAHAGYAILRYNEFMADDQSLVDEDGALMDREKFEGCIMFINGMQDGGIATCSALGKNIGGKVQICDSWEVGTKIAACLPCQKLPSTPKQEDAFSEGDEVYPRFAPTHSEPSSKNGSRIVIEKNVSSW
jgi:hypothetical protein